MKKKGNKSIIKTKHVFTKNNQVYLKMNKHDPIKNKESDNQKEWFPINFQWIPVIELQKNLKASKMKKLITICAFFVLLFTSCSNNDLYIGEGEIITKEITLDNFNAINTLGSFHVNVSTGSTQKVEVIGHSNIIDLLEKKVFNETWNIELKNGRYINNPLTINIVIPLLNKAILKGSGKIVIDDFTSSETVHIGIFGSGDIEMNKNNGCKNLNVNLDGSGSIYAHDQFSDLEKLDLEIVGSGDYDGFANKTDQSTIHIDGSGDCNMTINTYLKAKINGSGKINYKGHPTIESSVKGSGKINDMN